MMIELGISRATSPSVKGCPSRVLGAARSCASPCALRPIHCLCLPYVVCCLGGTNDIVAKASECGTRVYFEQNANEIGD